MTAGGLAAITLTKVAAIDGEPGIGVPGGAAALSLVVKGVPSRRSP
jgi:hypothetical protein